MVTNPILSHLEELQSKDYHLVNKGFSFIGGMAALRILTEVYKKPAFLLEACRMISNPGVFSQWSSLSDWLISHAGDFCLRGSLGETQVEFPSRPRMIA